MPLPTWLMLHSLSFCILGAGEQVE